MKITPILTLLVALAISPFAHAGSGHDHAREAGPNGGRILTAVEPPAEFFVTADRKVQITFLGEDGKAIAPMGQIVVVTAGERANPTKLTFIKNAGGFVSEQALPGGNDLPTVVQIKATPDSKAAVAKFNLNLAQCPSCQLAEYACTCAH